MQLAAGSFIKLNHPSLPLFPGSAWEHTVLPALPAFFFFGLRTARPYNRSRQSLEDMACPGSAWERGETPDYPRIKIGTVTYFANGWPRFCHSRPYASVGMTGA